MNGFGALRADHPALNEAQSIGKSLQEIPAGLFCADHCSGQWQPRRYSRGSAARRSADRQGASTRLRPGVSGRNREASPGITALVLWMRTLPTIQQTCRVSCIFEAGQWDMVIGSRMLGGAEAGSLTSLQRFGSWLTTRLIRWLWGVSFTDLGPLRIISRDAFNELDLRDHDFGWNVEMQAKAARCHMKVTEIPVAYRKRRLGESKISGTLCGSLRAGFRILWTIFLCWSEPQKAQPPSVIQN